MTSMMHRGFTRKATGAKAGGLSCRRQVALFLALVMVTAMVAAPLSADAVTVDTTTAKSNDQGGNDVFGGIPTRVTWETVIDDGEDLSSLELDLPQGCDTSSATVTLTVLKDLDRLDVDATSTITDDSLKVDFAQPLASGERLRVEIYSISLPKGVDSVTLTGSYTTSTGETKDLPESPAINLVNASLTKRITNYLDNQAWVAAWNNVPILRTFLKPQLIVTSIPTLFYGWLRALALVFVGFPLAIPLGLLLAMLKMNRGKGHRIAKLPRALSGLVNFLRRFFGVLANIYINIYRGTPLFLQIYIAFFGLPLVLGFNPPSYPLAVVVLAMNSAAYLAEIFRAGIQSISKGQFEAAHSLGMNGWQTMFSVIIPQTIRRVIPTMTSEFILLYKDSSLLSAVGVMELMMFSKSLTANSGNMTPYIVAALYYLVVTLPLIKVVNRFEHKLALSEGSASPSADDEAKTAKRKRRADRKASKGEKPLVGNADDAPIDPILSSPAGHDSF